MKALLLALILLIELVSAGKDHDHWKPPKRKFNIEWKKDFRVDAVYQNSTYEDKFHFEVHLGNADHLVEVKFRYENHIDQNKTKLELDFDVQNLVEFLSTAEKPVFEGAKDLIVLKDAKWQPWINESEQVDGVEYYVFSTTTGYGFVLMWLTSRVLTVRVHMAVAPLTVSSLVVDPNSVKIDFHISDYPYDPSNVEPTRLAFVTDVKSKTESKERGEKGLKDHRLIFNDDPDLPLGSFSWVPSAVANDTDGSTEVEVVAWSSEKQRGKEFTIYYTFLTFDALLHPSKLVWDPRVGLDYEDESSGFCMGSLCGGAAVGLISGLLGGVVLVAVAILLFYSYRKRMHYQSL